MVDILLIEDNVELANLIQAFLNKEGFSLYHKESGEAALDWLKKEQAKLVLLDIMLPGIDGFTVCKEVRLANHIPIIIMSAKSLKSDKLLGYELGADDYLEKPVDTDLLVAKVKALMKRFYSVDKEHKVIISGAISIDHRAHKVYFHDKLLDLTVKEYELLRILVHNPNRSLSKEYLFNEVWGIDSDSEYQTLTVHIKMLRTKIEENDKAPKRITTVWGVGYRYEEI